MTIFSTDKAKTEGDAPAFKLFDKGVLQQISPSMVSEYKSCPQKSGFRRVIGIRSKRGKRYFAKGGAFDLATEKLFRAVGAGQKFSVDEAVQLALVEYDRRVKEEDVEATKEQEKEDRGDLTKALPIYWEKLGQHVKVSTSIEPQSEITVTLPSGLKVLSILDVVEEVSKKQLRVVDVKTASSQWKDGKAQEEVQTDVYPWALSHAAPKGMSVVGISYHVTEPQVKSANVKAHEVPIRPDRIKKLPMLLQVYGDAITDLYKRGGMAPPRISMWECGTCDFRRECEEAYGGTRPTFSNRKD